MDNLPELSLYVHLPWCDKKCPYCDFNITTDSLNDSVRELFNALKNDLDQSKPLINQRSFIKIKMNNSSNTSYAIQGHPFICRFVTYTQGDDNWFAYMQYN